MNKQIIKVGNISQNQYNDNFVDFRINDEEFLSINRNNILTIKSEYCYADEEATIWKVEVHTDDSVYLIYTHDVEELESFLLVAGSELSFSYYCKDSQRLIRDLLKTNDEAKKINDEIITEIRNGQKIIDELINHNKELIVKINE